MAEITVKGKLGKVQVLLKAPKNQYNSFGKYHYRSCEDIVEAVKPLCVEHGLTLTISDEIIAVGNRVYVKATASVSDTTGTVSVSGFAREPESKKGMDESQITGAASSYARKYALNGLFCIDDTKDADATNNGKAIIEKAESSGIETAPKEYKCCDCGKPFTAFTSKAGKSFNAGQAYHLSESMNIDGKPRCSACMDKAGTRKK